MHPGSLLNQAHPHLRQRLHTPELLLPQLKKVEAGELKYRSEDACPTNMPNKHIVLRLGSVTGSAQPCLLPAPSPRRTYYPADPLWELLRACLLTAGSLCSQTGTGSPSEDPGKRDIGESGSDLVCRGRDQSLSNGVLSHSWGS